ELLDRGLGLVCGLQVPLHRDQAQVVVDREKCTKCQMCWMYCPDAVITMDEEGIPTFDLVYCKGCMICEEVCPANAITRVRETEAKE
ncbi:MAG: 4Fe-4S binding protein, partial [Promethearchaeota archaeon]